LGQVLTQNTRVGSAYNVSQVDLHILIEFVLSAKYKLGQVNTHLNAIGSAKYGKGHNFTHVREG
jgi:hypothetical protein